ncbi:MAG: LacI family DNA-binding transcriptional regulator [Planctomycetes bacterium]|nr:LacI family DNA-binding transcriptional regulator [Planctomycetota bacterium]
MPPVSRPDAAPEKPKRITMTQIAKEAGVSQPTVSLVLSGRSAEFRIQSETAQRVWATAQRLGYRPRARRKRLHRGASSSTVRGPVVAARPAVFGTLFIEYKSLAGDIMYSPALMGLSRAATSIVEIKQFGGIGIDGLADFVRNNQEVRSCGGLVVVTHRDHTAEKLAPLDELGIPWVLVNRDPNGLRAPRVLMDTYGMAYGLMEDLLRRGHRRIAVLGTNRSIPSATGQRQGYREALTAAGCYDPALEYLDLNDAGDASSRDLIQRVLREHPDVTAVYVFFDQGAAGLYAGARAAGRRVPEDLSIVANGGQAAAMRVDPPLTTMRYPLLEMGEAAFRILDRMWRGEPVPERTYLPGELWSGGSVGNAPGT